MLQSSFRVLILLILVSVCGASCSTAEKSKQQAQEALERGEYAEAAAQFKRAYMQTSIKLREQRAQLAFEMGECYRRYGNSARALAAYRTAERLNFLHPLLQLRLGEMFLVLGEYKAAEASFKKALADTAMADLTERGLRSIANVIAQKDLLSQYKVRIATQFNSNRSDYSPVLIGEGKEQQLFLTSTRTVAQGNELSGVTAQKNGDIFVTRKDEKGEWKALESVGGAINSNYDEGTPSFSPDAQTMYFTVCLSHPTQPKGAEIWSSLRTDATWAKPQRLPLSKDTLSSYAHPAVSPDGKWLYFVSDMPGGYGEYDLWRVALPLRSIGGAENLGPNINTQGNEKFPSFDAFGNLYFSSDGRDGIGGLDLYRAIYDTLLKDWKVEHLPSPMNSSGDDFGLTFDGKRMRGFFSSSRATNGRGWDKIYEFFYPETAVTLRGWVYEQEGYELPEAQVYVVGDDGTNIKIPVKTDGSFDFDLHPNVNYLFLATCEGYLNYPQRISIHQQQDAETIVLQFPLPSLTLPVLVRNVFYTFNSADLTTESSAALDRLVQLLIENPHITIELAAHTDQRGTAVYNQFLSQRRAESVVRYLHEKGIPPERLTAVGYGKTEPKVVNKRLTEIYDFLHEGDTLTGDFIRKLTDNQQDICHALNRRTEFRVLRNDYGLAKQQDDRLSQ